MAASEPKFARHPPCPEEQMTSEWGLGVRHFGRLVVLLSRFLAVVSHKRKATQSAHHCVPGAVAGAEFDAAQQHMREIPRHAALDGLRVRDNPFVERIVLEQTERAGPTGSTVVAKSCARANRRTMRCTCTTKIPPSLLRPKAQKRGA